MEIVEPAGDVVRSLHSHGERAAGGDLLVETHFMIIEVIAMQPTRKGTRIYTRIQHSTGTEIAVRKLKQRFVLFIDNTETAEFARPEAAMEAADRMADEQPMSRPPASTSGETRR